MVKADGDRTSPGGEDGNGTETARSFAMLLGPGHFPGPGWAVVEERSWPTGQLDPQSGKSQRALEFGGITAWRSLDQQGHRSAAWVEVVPYASATDADTSLRQVPRFFTGPGQPDETVHDEREVEDQSIPGCPRAWIFEKSTLGPAGSRWSRYVGLTVDRILVLACFTRWGRPWPWAEAIDLVVRQAEQVRTTMAEPTDV